MSDGPELSANRRALPLPDQWREIEPLVDAVLDAATDEREQLITRLSGEDVARQQLLRSLIDECEHDTPLLDAPATANFGSLLVSDAEYTLPDVLSDRYRIEREIGSGGMARVYLARDLKHDRSVAVKVIRPGLAVSLGRERFLREIAIAARLRHPNIVPVYDSGDADGVLFFVMPFEAGPSVRERLAGTNGLPPSEYISVLRDVARALQYAHEQGIVHRDVKPDNIMLSGGAAVVTDFGIAKAVSVARAGTSVTTTLTKAGAGIGTPAYMAPEQAVGDPATDHRADIYAFGCVAYELVCGHPPFHGMLVHQIVAAHVSVTPVSLALVRPDVPPSIAALVMRCLAKEPDDRPQSAADLLAALMLPLADASSPPPASVTAAETSPPPAPQRTARRLLLAFAIVAVVGALFVAFRNRPVASAAEATVSVLPLRTEGADSVQRALAEGLSDEIATALFRVPGIRVMSKRGAANYRDLRVADTDRLGRELGARYLVMGTLREVSGRLRVLASLVRASDGAVLWTDGFDRAQDDLATVRADIARAVGDTLRRLAVPEGTLLPLRVQAARREPNPDAYRAYVLAQRELDQRGQSIESSIRNFEQAVALDTLFADAWAGLSLARALAPYFTPLTPRDVDAAVRAAAARALSLDSTLAAAHVARGVALQHAYRWDSAAVEFQEGVRLRASGDVEPLIQYARYLMSRGQLQASIDQLILARRTEPASAVVLSNLSYAYYLAGQLDSAMANSQRAYESDTTNLTTLAHGALIRQRLGMTAAARTFAERALPLNVASRYVLAQQGDTAASMARLRAAERLPNRPGQVGSLRAGIMLGIGDTAAALDALERATADGELWPAARPVIDPMYETVWPSARFAALLQRVGLASVQPELVSRTHRQ